MKFAGGHVYFSEISNGCGLNITCDDEGYGSAVLIRALLPTCGPELMLARRKRYSTKRELDDSAAFKTVLCNGPLVICDSLGIDDLLYENSQKSPLSALSGPIEIRAAMAAEKPPLLNGPRVGLDKQREKRSADILSIEEKHVADSHQERRWRWVHADHRKFIGASTSSLLPIAMP
jgi:3-methyladenine DNA glycosylase Mpg